MITGSVPVGRYSQQSILNLTQEDNIHGGTSFTPYGIRQKAKLTHIPNIVLNLLLLKFNNVLMI